jgi:hypothetical protein
MPQETLLHHDEHASTGAVSPCAAGAGGGDETRCGWPGTTPHPHGWGGGGPTAGPPSGLAAGSRLGGLSASAVTPRLRAATPEACESLLGTGSAGWLQGRHPVGRTGAGPLLPGDHDPHPCGQKPTWCPRLHHGHARSCRGLTRGWGRHERSARVHPAAAPAARRGRRGAYLPDRAPAGEGVQHGGWRDRRESCPRGRHARPRRVPLHPWRFARGRPRVWPDRSTRALRPRPCVWRSVVHGRAAAPRGGAPSCHACSCPL